MFSVVGDAVQQLRHFLCEGRERQGVQQNLEMRLGVLVQGEVLNGSRALHITPGQVHCMVNPAKLLDLYKHSAPAHHVDEDRFQHLCNWDPDK